MVRAGFMSSSSDKFAALLGRDGRPRGLEQDELADWAAATADVRPRGGPQKLPQKIKQPIARPHRPSAGMPAMRVPVRAGAHRPNGGGLDKGTDRRLRRGELPIEGRLDLHGMTAATAEKALAAYLTNAQARGLRCILVITGKGARTGMDDFGRPRAGILRTAFAEWLACPPFAPLVVAWRPAQPKDGGAGAHYVLLRRNRP